MYQFVIPQQYTNACTGNLDARIVNATQNGQGHKHNQLTRIGEDEQALLQNGKRFAIHYTQYITHILQSCYIPTRNHKTKINDKLKHSK